MIWVLNRAHTNQRNYLLPYSMSFHFYKFSITLISLSVVGDSNFSFIFFHLQAITTVIVIFDSCSTGWSAPEIHFNIIYIDSERQAFTHSHIGS